MTLPPASESSSAAATPPLLHVADGIATIRLNRPAQRNRLEDGDLHALLDHFARIEADPHVQVLVLTAVTDGQPRPVFSAGYHVGGLAGEAGGPSLFQRVPDALERLRPVTVCALNGSVYGGATDLLLACDLRLGLAGSEFRMPANALGLHYYASGLRRYVERLGLNLAQQAFLTGASMPVEALQASSLFLQLLPDPAALQAATQALAAQVAALAPLSTALTKQSLLDVAAGTADAGTLSARETVCAESADFAEGRAAFAERRAPRFTGR